jgi:hypothetical protein
MAMADAVAEKNLKKIHNFALIFSDKNCPTQNVKL